MFLLIWFHSAEPKLECLLAAQCLIPSAVQLLAQAENPISVGSVYFSTSKSHTATLSSCLSEQTEASLVMLTS